MTGSDDRRWPDEPDDPSGDPEPDEAAIVDDLGPDIPEVEVPQAPDPSENEVSSELVRNFWKLVAIFNLALFALALGPMLIFFRGEWSNGGLVFAIGVIGFIYGYWRYRRVTSGDDHNG